MDENIDINAVKPLDRHWMLTNDLHVMFLNCCHKRSKYFNLFKGVTADISVVEFDWGSSYDMISKKLNNRKR